MRNIFKTVSIVEEFNEDLFNELNIGVELQDFTEPNLTKDEKAHIVREYKRKLIGFKNKVSMHGPFLDMFPASPDNRIRKVSQDRYIETLKIGEQLGASYVIFHSQINPYINREDIINLNNRQAKEMWEYVIDESGYTGIIAVENLYEKDPRLLKRYIEYIDNPQVKINLDIGHASLGDVNLDFWLSQLKDSIRYMHIHVNNRVYDTHSVPSNGDLVNLDKLLDKYDINASLCLEYSVNDLEKEVRKYDFLR